MVGRLVSWLVGRLVGLSLFPKRAGSNTSMLLSEHLFKIMLPQTNFMIVKVNLWELWPCTSIVPVPTMRTKTGLYDSTCTVYVLCTNVQELWPDCMIVRTWTMTKIHDSTSKNWELWWPDYMIVRTRTMTKIHNSTSKIWELWWPDCMTWRNSISGYLNYHLICGNSDQRNYIILYSIV